MTIAGNTVAQLPDTCDTLNFPDIHFKRKSTRVRRPEKNKLDSIVSFLLKKPSCAIKVMYGGGSCLYCTSNLGWDRAFSVINYLLVKGLDEKRWLLVYTGDDDLSTIKLALSPSSGISVKRF